MKLMLTEEEASRERWRENKMSEEKKTYTASQKIKGEEKAQD
jgi:hypothetical protein